MDRNAATAEFALKVRLRHLGDLRGSAQSDWPHVEFDWKDAARTACELARQYSLQMPVRAMGLFHVAIAVQVSADGFGWPKNMDWQPAWPWYVMLDEHVDPQLR